MGVRREKLIINQNKILLGGLFPHIYTLHCKGGRLKYDNLTSLQPNQVITGINNYKLLKSNQSLLK